MHAAQSTEDLKRKTQQAGQEVKETVTETGEVFKSNVAQLLGVRGGEQTADKWKIRLQLTKPVTWVPLIWGASAVIGCAAPAMPHATAVHACMRFTFQGFLCNTPLMVRLGSGTDVCSHQAAQS